MENIPSQSENKMREALEAIQSIVDSYFKGKIKITIDGEYDPQNKIYPLDSTMGMIFANVYDGLQKNVPNIREWRQDKSRVPLREQIRRLQEQNENGN